MPNWEYKTLKVQADSFFGVEVDTEQIDQVLNEAGQDGWELVTAFDTHMWEGESRHLVFAFKRQL